MAAVVVGVVHRALLQPEPLELHELFAQILHASVANCSSYLAVTSAGTCPTIMHMHALVMQ